MPRPVATERRSALLDAALRVVVDQGLRGLTHRAVDRAADVAEGTTSAYFRTRRALQLALAEQVSRRLADDVDRVVHDMADCAPGSPEALAAVVGLFGRWLDDSPLLLAKVELSLEARRDPELAVALAHDRDRVVGIVAEALASKEPVDGPDGACGPVEDAERWAAIVVASFDGLLLAALAQPAGQRDAFVDDAVRLTLRPLQPGPVDVRSGGSQPA